MNILDADSTETILIAEDAVGVLLACVAEGIQQKEEAIQNRTTSIHYALKECEALVWHWILFADEVENPNLDEDAEPVPIMFDNMQSYSIPKQPRVIEEKPKETENEDDPSNDAENSVTAEMLMNGKFPSIFMTRVKDRSYVRSMIAKEKERSLNYSDVLNNSVTFYGNEYLDAKTTTLFKKYIKNHSLGPLKVDQQVSPLRIIPPELVQPRNVSFSKCYHSGDKIDGNGKVTLQTLELDPLKINPQMATLDFSKITIKNDSSLNTIDRSTILDRQFETFETPSSEGEKRKKNLTKIRSYSVESSNKKERASSGKKNNLDEIAEVSTSVRKGRYLHPIRQKSIETLDTIRDDPGSAEKTTKDSLILRTRLETTRDYFESDLKGQKSHREMTFRSEGEVTSRDYNPEELEAFGKQKLMRKELSHLISERKRQQQLQTKLKLETNKKAITLFSGEKRSNDLTQLPYEKSISSSRQIYNIFQHPSSSNTNHLKQSFLPHLRTQRLDNFKQ